MAAMPHLIVRSDLRRGIFHLADLGAILPFARPPTLSQLCTSLASTNLPCAADPVATAWSFPWLLPWLSNWCPEMSERFYNERGKDRGQNANTWTPRNPGTLLNLSTRFVNSTNQLFAYCFIVQVVTRRPINNYPLIIDRPTINPEQCLFLASPMNTPTQTAP